MTRPEVSVVIPTRDRWPLLSTTLRSALAQEGVRHEVIVVDDGSQDETSDRLAAVDDPRLRVLRHEAPRGVAIARNAGIAEARGEWLAFLDDDDLWSPDKLRAQVAAARACDAIFSYGAVVILDEGGRALEVLPAPDPEDPVSLVLPGLIIPAGASNLLAATSVVRDVGGFDAGLAQFADWDLWLRLADTGRAAACPEVLVAYVQHERSMILTEDRRSLVREFEKLVAKHADLVARRGVRLDRAGLTDWMGWAEARAGHRVRAARDYLIAGLLYARQGERWGPRYGIGRALVTLRGERILDSGRRLSKAPPVDEPEWLALYRHPG